MSAPRAPRACPTALIVLRHALRAALLPLVSYLGPAVAGILTGSLVVEQIFGLPGIGRYFVQARAQPRLHAGDGRGDLLRGASSSLLNLLADLLYARARSAREVRHDRVAPHGAAQCRSAGARRRRAAACGTMRARRLFRNRAAVVSMVVLAIIALMAIFAPLLSPYAYRRDRLQRRLLRARLVAGPDGALQRRRHALVRHRRGRAATCSCACCTARASRWRSAWSPRWSVAGHRRRSMARPRAISAGASTS